MEQITLSVSEVFGWSVGVSAIVAVCVGALWSIYFNRIKEGQKAEFQKQIENLKAKNDKLNYITKTQFDAEFKMYQELSESIYVLINTIKKFDQSQTVANVAYIKIAQNLLDETKKAFQIFEQLLFQYAPFIQEKIFLICEHFRIVVHNKFISFHIEEVFNENNIVPRISKISKNFNDETKEIFLLHKEIIEALRKYLGTLKIHED